MRRFFNPVISEKYFNKGELITLDGEEAHHALKVLRIGKGDTLILLNGKGEEFLCRCVDTQKNRLILTAIEYTKHPPSNYQVVLIQSIPKGRLIESIIEKSIELGVSRIVPLITQRVVPNWENSENMKRVERWRQIAISAMKQCGQTYLPQIDLPVKIEDYLSKNEKFELSLVCALSGKTAHLRSHIEQFKQKHCRNPESVSIWIGPEGDFTPEELTLIKNFGALPITLGNLVLRVETASLCALSIVNYELTISQ
ncbi:MAG: RsmE family RNA methyltransferase [Verrucomicrobiia bacterium]